MAWSVGRFLVAPGASVRLEYNWQGRYHGVQYAMAKPVLDLCVFFPEIYGRREVMTSGRTLRAPPRHRTARRMDLLRHRDQHDQ
jgi:hypothetical protein